MLDNILSYQMFSGQIFSHTALRFAKEFSFDYKYLYRFGKIKEIIATSPKDWLHYSIHIIEPVINSFQLNENFQIVDKTKSIDGRTELKVKWENDLTVKFITTGKSTDQISIKIKGANKSETLIFHDTYYAFRTCINEFINGVKIIVIFIQKKIYTYT